MKNRLLQAYKQAPWRIQLQWMGLFLLILVLIAAVTGVYLNINERAATAGRQILIYESKITEINYEIASLRTDLAEANSTAVMMEKAKSLNFELIDPQQAVYLEVPGYQPDSSPILASSQAPVLPQKPIITSSYKASLWDWFLETLWRIPESPIEIQVDVSP